MTHRTYPDGRFRCGTAVVLDNQIGLIVGTYRWATSTWTVGADPRTDESADGYLVYIPDEIVIKTAFFRARHLTELSKYPRMMQACETSSTPSTGSGS